MARSPGRARPRDVHCRPASWLALFLAMVVAARGQDAEPPVRKAAISPTPAERVRYYEARVAAQPRNYPVLALLGEACLDRARETHDPSWLARARDAFDRSLAIQESFEAFKGLAALCNYRHRFSEALKWAEKASEALPSDTGVTALRVEACLGLGRIDEARRLLPAGAGDASPDDYHLAAALGAWQAARHDPDAASRSFLRASRIAARLDAPDLAQWARVRAAGVFLDAGRPQDARPLLDAAAAAAPGDRFLWMHESEWLESQGRVADSLALVEALLDNGDPGLHARAATLARSLGRREVADVHFTAAERTWKAALDAGEAYPLEALARLYLEAGVKPAEALDLARRNLDVKRDASARETFERARAALRTAMSPTK